MGAPGTAPRGRLIRPLARPLIVAGDHHAGPPRRPRSLSAALLDRLDRPGAEVPRCAPLAPPQASPPPPPTRPRTPSALQLHTRASLRPLCLSALVRRCNAANHCAACKRALLGSHDVPSKLTQRPFAQALFATAVCAGKTSQARPIRLASRGALRHRVLLRLTARRGGGRHGPAAAALAGRATRGVTRRRPPPLKAWRAVGLAVCRGYARAESSSATTEAA